jgi:hypothetical protein
VHELGNHADLYRGLRKGILAIRDLRSYLGSVGVAAPQPCVLQGEFNRACVELAAVEGLFLLLADSAFAIAHDRNEAIIEPQR